MIKIEKKPLSINEAYKWRKVKTKKLTEYKDDIFLLITTNLWNDYFNIDFNKKWLKLKLDIEWWLSSSWWDIDNPLKPFIDALQESLWFNDNCIYELNVKKKIVKKLEEYIKFELSEIFIK